VHPERCFSRFAACGVRASTLDAGQKRASGRSVDNVPEAFLGISQRNMGVSAAMTGRKSFLYPS
jgi:hypothetical protein